ncbi:MAG: hypothetical protein FWH51_03865 [Dehalococcoidia bacterium]|nr:hypothetical protein [Dehalococcoidia bacterium]
MKKLDLNVAVGMFGVIDVEKRLVCNLETGDFEWYNANIDLEDAEKFEDGAWIPAPSQRDIGEYDRMTGYVDTAANGYANALLSDALEGKVALRRFKDTPLDRIGLADERYAFRRNSCTDITREWCRGKEYEESKEYAF